MNKILNNENGYSLLLAVSVFLLFTILGLTIMTASITGAKRNVVSEQNLQAIELANSGIDTLKNYLYEEINTTLGSSGFTGEQLCQVIDKYDYDNDNEVLTGTNEAGEFIVYIKNDGTACKNIDELENLTVVSTGKAVNGQEKTVEAKINFGSTELETFKYALSARKSNIFDNKGICKLEGGNIFLHGGVEITGDIRADGNIITTEQGYENYGLVIGIDDFRPDFRTQRWVKSTKPNVTGENKNANVVLGGNFYTFVSKIDYFKHIDEMDFDEKAEYKKLEDQDISNAFLNEVNLKRINATQPSHEYDIKGESHNYYLNPNSSWVTYANAELKREGGILFGSSYLLIPENRNYLSQEIVPRYLEGIIWKSWRYDGNFTLDGDYHFKKFSTDGALTITNKSKNHTSVKFENGAYIKEGLIIGTGSNRNNYSNVDIDGTIFVDDDLVIKGANARFNSLIFVDGNVIIENSRIKELTKEDGSQGSLIIFATGNITIRNNNVYNNNFDSINPIRGFFYSHESIELFGTISNIKIEGGLSAKRIVLNGVRGYVSTKCSDIGNSCQYIPYFKIEYASSNSCDTWDIGDLFNIGKILRCLIGGIIDLLNSLIKDGQYFESASIQGSSNSRLHIIYNDEMIEETMKTYTDLKAREEEITITIEEPKVIERVIK